MKWAVENEHIPILQAIGYTKHANNISYQIFQIICASGNKEELEVSMTDFLDLPSKEAIA